MATTKPAKKDDGNIDKMLSKFKRNVMNSGKLAELRKHEYAVGPSEKAKLKRIEAAKKRKKTKRGGNNNGN